MYVKPVRLSLQDSSYIQIILSSRLATLNMFMYAGFAGKTNLMPQSFANGKLEATVAPVLLSAKQDKYLYFLLCEEDPSVTCTECAPPFRNRS